MSVTFTTNLNLSKPSVGGSSNVWGGLINDDLDAVDAIFTGAGTGTSVGLKVGSGKTLDVSAGTLTLADDQISGDKVEGGTIASITISSLTATALSSSSVNIDGGAIDGTPIGANSASTGAFSTISSSGAATLSSLSTSSADINGGAIDGTTVGASSASTGNFSSVSISGTNIFLKVYPVGAVYVSTSSTNPSSLFGGTWSAIGEGRVLQAITSGSTGNAGSSSKTVTIGFTSSGSHSHNHQWYDGTRSSSTHGIDFASSSSGHRSGSFNSSSSAVNFSADPDTNDFYTDQASTTTITVSGSGSTSVDTTQAHYKVFMFVRTA
tara:strand:- start:1129 stop:2097 length:969 start_codon:yes stop_codon:yes gene_type:complete